ncbi:unnamed protein product [Owenia fusiformis]|uniref:Serine/threonine-protein kinase 40 n=1 Tax=Owenia fusiformis TaxID=6347 RepID=A0A8S4Q851_OWEFU|nr:unnamed protein product [Owenia fusiformis]
MKRRTPSGESLTSVSYKRERIDNVAGVKMAGPYLIGPRISQSPVSSIVQCLGRKIGTDDFYMLKILTMENSDRESQDDKQGKMLLHTEYSLLSLLHNQGGVVHHHGLFKDLAAEDRVVIKTSHKSSKTTKSASKLSSRTRTASSESRSVTSSSGRLVKRAVVSRTASSESTTSVDSVTSSDTISNCSTTGGKVSIARTSYLRSRDDSCEPKTTRSALSRSVTVSNMSKSQNEQLLSSNQTMKLPSQAIQSPTQSIHSSNQSIHSSSQSIPSSSHSSSHTPPSNLSPSIGATHQHFKKRIVLVLDCLVPHEFSDKNKDLVNLQHYVIKEKKLTEREAVIIFYDIVRVVENLHKKNIVHRDLKLGNMMLNKRSLRVTITNFCLGKHLVCEDDPLKDQRGSPAYISPDVLSGKPYLGKPSDMWALGVVLFTMLYGQFPFYDSDPIKLFKKIKTADFTIPPLGVQDSTSGLIKQLLVLDPKERLTASQVLEALHGIITTWRAMYNRSGPLQVVPDIDDLIPSTLKNPPMNRKFPSGLSEFEKKLKEYNESEKDHPRAKVKKLIQLQRKPNVPPPIRRLNEDAQAMTSMEVRAHRHLVHPQ